MINDLVYEAIDQLTNAAENTLQWVNVNESGNPGEARYAMNVLRQKIAAARQAKISVEMTVEDFLKEDPLKWDYRDEVINLLQAENAALKAAKSADAHIYKQEVSKSFHVTKDFIVDKYEVKYTPFQPGHTHCSDCPCRYGQHLRNPIDNVRYIAVEIYDHEIRYDGKPIFWGSVKGKSKSEIDEIVGKHRKTLKEGDQS